MRRAGVGFPVLAELGEDPGLEERLDQRQHALVLDPRPHPVHQGRVVDGSRSTPRCPRPAPTDNPGCRRGGSRRSRRGPAAWAGTRRRPARSRPRRSVPAPASAPPGRPGRRPSESRGCGPFPTRPAWGSCVPAPAAAGTSRPSDWPADRPGTRDPDPLLDVGDRQAVDAGSVRPPVARDPVERHDQRRRVVHEVEQVIEPAARIGHRPTVKLGLHLRYPRPRPHQAATAGASPFGGASFGITASFPSRNRCRPSPCAPALPGSEYYGGSAPSRTDRPTMGPAPPRPLDADGRARPRTVPVFTVIRSTKEEPDSVPAASPRLPRSPSPRPPWQLMPTTPGVPRPDTSGQVRTAPGPDPPGSSRCRIKGRNTPVPRVLLSVTLAGPAPSGSTGTSRLCQGCSHPPRHLPDQAALSSTALLRQDSGEGLSPPLESQRLTAHARPAAHLRGDHDDRLVPRRPGRPSAPATAVDLARSCRSRLDVLVSARSARTARTRRVSP